MRKTTLLVWGCCALVGCKKEAAAPVEAAPPSAAARVLEPTAAARAHTPVEAGPLREPMVHVETAVYLLGTPPKDLMAQALKAARVHAPKLTVVEKLGPGMKLPVLHFGTPPIAEYAPPTADSLRYFARGLSPEQLERTPTAATAFVINGVAEGNEVEVMHRAVLALTHALGVQWKGVLWDEATREVFSADAWSERRLAWKSGAPDMTKHVTMHSYRDGELVRIVSLGMSKFGLPDVVVNDVSPSVSRPVGNLMNLAMQTMEEQPSLAKEGQLPVNLDTLVNEAAKQSQQGNLLKNAQRTAVLDVAFTPPEDGDPPNRLMALRFDLTDGESEQQGQHRVTGAVYGSEDNITQVESGNAELQAASKRANAAFLKLKRSFRGRKPGQTLQAKGPFKTDTGGVEWMWIDVVAWKGSKVQGILNNEPFEVSNLKVGARVEIEEADVFDYILTRPDGTVEGNETSAIIQRLQGE